MTSQTTRIEGPYRLHKDDGRQSRRPKHATFAEAEAEALRLREQYPDQCFVIAQEIATVGAHG
jgi:hypothetical protein